MTDAFERARAKLAADDWEGAISELESACAAEPTNFPACFLRGYARYQLQQFELAIEDFDRYLAVHREATALFYRGDARRALGDARGAVDDLTHSLEHEQSAEALYFRGLAFEELGSWTHALADYDACIDLKPDLGQPYFDRAFVRGKLADHRGAIHDLDRYLAEHPNSARAWQQRGARKLDAGDYRGGAADWARACELDPSCDRSVLAAFAELQRLSDGSDEAALAVMLCKRALSKLELDEPATAEIWARRAIEADPFGAAPRYLCGCALGALGRYADAVIEFERAVALEPGFARAWRELGTARALTGDLPRAITHYDRAIELDPGDEAARHARAETRERAAIAGGSAALSPAATTPPRTASPAATTPPRTASPAADTPPRIASPAATTPPRTSSPAGTAPPCTPSAAGTTPPRTPSPAAATPPRAPSPAATTSPRTASPAATTPPRTASPAATTPPRTASPAATTPPRTASPAATTPPRVLAPAATTPPRTSSATPGASAATAPDRDDSARGRQLAELRQRYRDRAQWRIGDVVHDLYEVREIFDGGAMGTVHRVFHRGWRIELAVKTPRATFLADHGVDQFIREAQTWVDLGLHPNIVSCYYVRTLDGVPRVFAELVGGGTLDDWIGDRRLYAGGPATALARILDIAVQLAWGLGFAHERGLIHQDVKPANVLVTDDGIAKVSDFGLAAAASTDMMTPAYCSPEQSARGTLSTTTDVWSWGVTVLAMFEGGASWQTGVAAPHVLRSLVDSPDPEIPRIPPELTELLDACFSLDPSARPTCVAAAAEVAEIYAASGTPYPRARPEAATLLANSLNNRGVSLLDLGAIAGALRAFSDALTSDPTHVSANLNLAATAWQHWDALAIPDDLRGDRLEAESSVPSRSDVARYLDTALEYEDSPRVRTMRAWFRLHASDPFGTLEELEGISRDTADAGVLLQLGMAHVELDRSDARELLEAARALAPADPHVLRELARAYTTPHDTGRGPHERRADDLIAAVALLAQAVQRRPDDPHLLVDLGAVLRRIGEDARARSMFEQALAIRPGCPYALSRLGSLLVATEPDRARALLVRALEACPGLTGANRELELLRELPPDVSLDDDTSWRRDGGCANDDAWLLAPAGQFHLQRLNSHLVPVRRLAISPSGNLAAAMEDDQIRFWNLVTLEKAAPTERVSAKVITFVSEERLLAATPDPSPATKRKDKVAIVSLRGDATVELDPAVEDLGAALGPDRGAPVHTAMMEVCGAKAAAFMSDYKRIVVADRGKALRVYDFARGPEDKLAGASEAHTAEISSIATVGSYVLSGGHDHLARLWRDDLELVRTLTGHAGAVTHVAMFPDGRRGLSASLDGRLCLWDLARGRQLASITHHSGEAGNGFTAAALSPNGTRIVAAAGSEGTVLVGDITWREARTLPLRLETPAPMIELPTGSLEAIDLEAQVTALVTRAGRDPEHALSTLRTALALKGHARNTIVLERIAALGLARAGTRDGWLRHTLAPGFQVYSVAFSSDGNRCVVGCARGSAFVFELPSKTLLESSIGWEAPSRGVAMLSPQRFAHTEFPGVTIKTIDGPSAERRLGRLGGHNGGELGALVASPDQRHVFACGAHPSYERQDADDGLLWIIDADGSGIVEPIEIHDDRCLALAIDHTGARIATSDATSVRFWDVTGATPTRIAEAFFDRARSLAFLDDNRLAVGCGREIVIHDIAAERTLARITLEPTLDEPHGSITTLAASPDGRFVAIGVGSRVVIACVAAPHDQRVIGQHRGGVEQLDFSPDGRFVISGGGSNALVWEIDWTYEIEAPPSEPAPLALRHISGPWTGDDEFVLPAWPTTIGRGSDCDLSLEEDMLSNQHALISFDLGTFSIEDLGSTNGTFLNGENLLHRTPLREGDRILVGTVLMKVVAVEPELDEPDEMDEPDPVGSWELRFIAGPYTGGLYPLSRTVTIGSGDDCEVIFGGDLVSIHHARIDLEDGTVTIEDLGSANGTFVNDNKVTKKRVLSTGDRVLIGTTIFRVVGSRG